MKTWSNILKEVSEPAVKNKLTEQCRSFIAEFIDKTLEGCYANSGDNEFYEVDEDECGEQGEVFEGLGKLIVCYNIDMLLPFIQASVKARIEEYAGRRYKDEAGRKAQEWKLGWLINLLAHLVDLKNFGVETTWSNPATTKVCALVFRLINSSLTLCLHHDVEEYLELALLRFCSAFKKEVLTMVGQEKYLSRALDEVEECNPYEPLEAVLKLADMGSVAEIIFKKLINNLAVYYESRRITEFTLSTLIDLVHEPLVTAKFTALPVIQTLTEHHLVTRS